MKKLLNIFVTLAIFSLSSCTEYWWTRGQPPSVSELLSQSQSRLENAISTSDSANATVKMSKDIENGLLKVVSSLEEKNSVSEVRSSLYSLANNFYALDGNLTMGSRAAYGELSGQLRSFVSKIENGSVPSPQTFGLFTARTLNFLASELNAAA